MNSFGKKNCMQPVRSSACTQGALITFLLDWEGVGEVFFLHFLSFPMCSHHISNLFTMFLLCSPNNFSITPPFFTICLGECCLPLTSSMHGPKGGGNITLVLLLRLLHVQSFCVISLPFERGMEFFF